MSQLSTEKLKDGVSDSPQIGLFKRIVDFMSEVELNAWTSFVLVVRNFLGNYKTKNYVELLINMISCFRGSFRDFGRKISMMVNYIHSYLHCFPENLDNISEEQGEKFHQNIKTVDDFYQK